MAISLTGNIKNKSDRKDRLNFGMYVIFLKPRTYI